MFVRTGGIEKGKCFAGSRRRENSARQSISGYRRLWGVQVQADQILVRHGRVLDYLFHGVSVSIIDTTGHNPYA